MPQQYHPNLKGKGWVCVEDAEADAEEVNKVWEMQKKALLDSTICKEIHSLTPDLSCVVDSDRLCAYLPWLPPGV